MECVKLVMLARWKCTQLNHLGPSVVALRLKLLFAEFKWYKSPGNDGIPTEVILVAAETLRPEIRELSNSVRNKRKLPQQLNGSLIIFVNKNGDTTNCSNCYLLRTETHHYSSVLLNYIDPTCSVAFFTST
jgi:hypothetical protein